MTMKRILMLIALGSCGCERQVDRESASPDPASLNQMLADKAPVSKPPQVLPMPKDQAELDRMILAGYTPHGNHVHAPGVKSCPLAQGDKAVM
jgi:hypothetical protein